MRLSRLAGAILAGVTLLVSPSAVHAGADSTTSSGNRFDVSAQLAGRYPIPQGIYENPCEAPFVYSSNRLTTDAGARGLSRDRTDGVKEYLWEVKCQDPVTSAVSTVTEFWIAFPTPQDLVVDLMAIIPGYLDPPEVEWPNMNQENNWLFVKVPMDFRINNLGPITITASVPNVFTGGSVTASATATPDKVNFVSGEGGGTSCSAEQAAEAYVAGSFGGCFYRYDNSSAIAGGAFGTSTTVDWAMTSTPADPSIPASLPTSASQELAVSEVQAIVTCYGGSC